MHTLSELSCYPGGEVKLRNRITETKIMLERQSSHSSVHIHLAQKSIHKQLGAGIEFEYFSAVNNTAVANTQ